MNSFLTRYSSTSPDADIRKAKELFGEDEDISDMMWGSTGGFGNLASGVPMFKVPSVQDVRTPKPSSYIMEFNASVPSFSLCPSSVCTRMTMQTPHAASRSSTGQRHWRSGSRVVLSSQSILEQLREVMSVRIDLLARFARRADISQLPVP